MWEAAVGDSKTRCELLLGCALAKGIARVTLRLQRSRMVRAEGCGKGVADGKCLALGVGHGLG